MGGINTYGHHFKELPAGGRFCCDGLGHLGRSCLKPARFEARWLVRTSVFRDSEVVVLLLCPEHAAAFASEHGMRAPTVTAAGPDKVSA